jgi:hypothetical protein
MFHVQAAKADCTEAESKRKALQSDVDRLRQTIADSPVTKVT